VLFAAARKGGWSNGNINVLSLKDRQYRLLIEGGIAPRYAPTNPAASGQRGTGHIVYWRNATLFAVPFDLRRLEVTGSPSPILEGVAGVPSIGVTSYSFSDTGTLVYIPGGLSPGTLVWADREGKIQPLPIAPNHFSQPRLSPDGQRVALSIGSGETRDIWSYDISRRTMTRLTFQGVNRPPVWTADGKRVTFSSSESGKSTISWVSADGSGPVENLVTMDGLLQVGSWSEMASPWFSHVEGKASRTFGLCRSTVIENLVPWCRPSSMRPTQVSLRTVDGSRITPMNRENCKSTSARFPA
jgi:WD40 repeat protein